MKYTKYFGLMTKEQGRLNLPTMQFQRLMNIVHLEGVLFGLHKAKEANKDTQAYHKYDILIFNENTKLNELTGNLTPDLLLKEMVRFPE
ncbi:MAG: hypothetical protein Q7U21_06635 [Lutibacter sp.]|jgi:hypothetical protein|nr:hypothetical protein [Lutibacter sp.]